MPHQTKQNLQRATLQKLRHKSGSNKELINLRLAYSEDKHLLDNYINKLVYIRRVHPRHLPTQASFRWSTVDPPITNWPRACINTLCPQGEHEWTNTMCWSVRDILQADSDEVLITWDHDNIEGKIHDLIVSDEAAIEAHKQGYDLHTITCCDIFNYDYPTNLRNPHTSLEDHAWRIEHDWSGKDTKRRVIAKNFNHGAKYTDTWKFVYVIPGIEKYGISRDHLATLAQKYIAGKGEAWDRKLAIMQKIRKDGIARTLYGGRRIFYDHTPETGKEGFSHMISGTVSDYNNETLIMMQRKFGEENFRLLHNAHDGDKVAIKRSYIEKYYEKSDRIIGTPNIDSVIPMLKSIIERPITYESRTLIMTAGVKIYFDE